MILLDPKTYRIFKDILKQPYNQNRKLFKASDFKRKYITLDINDGFIVRYSKGFPDNEEIYGGDTYYGIVVNMKDFLCLK